PDERDGQDQYGEQDEERLLGAQVVVVLRPHADAAQARRQAPEPAGHLQKRQRVAPPGSTVSTAVADPGVMRNTCQGGGPADGALYSAVSAIPDSSGRACQPSSFHRFAKSATTAGSVTRCASPSTTRSNSSVATASVQRGSRARLRPLRERSPVSNQNASSTHTAPTPVTWGLPSGSIVASQHVWRFGPPVPGAWGISDPSRDSTRVRSMSVSPYRSARFFA